MSELRGASWKVKLLIICLLIVLIDGIISIIMFLSMTDDNEEVEAVVLNVGDLAINYLDGNEINIVKPQKKIMSTYFR